MFTNIIENTGLCQYENKSFSFFLFVFNQISLYNYTMKWLIITDDNNYKMAIETTLLNADKKNKITVSTFDLDALKKIKKNFLDFAGCVIVTDNVDKFDYGTVIQLTGYFAAHKIPVFTNLVYFSIETLFEKDGVTFFNNYNAIISHLYKKYTTIEEGSKKRIAKKKLLDRGIPFTADCFATYIAKNKFEVVNEFLEAGMSVNSRDDMGVPMLNIACRNDNFELAEMLLDLGSELNASSDDRGYTAVMDAVWRGNEKITKMLIARGAELNTINKEGQNNLILAVGADRYNIVKILAENGADPDVKDMMGMSAYQYATLFKKEKIAEILRPFHKES